MNLHGNPNVNRDHLITWPSGQPVHAALRDLLLESWDRTGNRYDVTHGRLAWQADGGLFVDLRLYVTKPAQEPQLWKIRFPYQADEATGACLEASLEELERFVMMIRTHIAEWQDTGCLALPGWQSCQMYSARQRMPWLYLE